MDINSSIKAPPLQQELSICEAGVDSQLCFVLSLEVEKWYGDKRRCLCGIAVDWCEFRIYLVSLSEFMMQREIE